MKIFDEANKRNKNILILAGGIIVLVFLITAYFLIFSRTSVEKTRVVTDKNKYEKSSVLKVKIKNGLKTDICFSSCYPYYFEKKDGVWEGYQYESCPQEDKAEKCLVPDETKAFEAKIPIIEKGIHRLAIPACVGCNLHDKFRKDQWIYSNEFDIQ